MAPALAGVVVLASDETGRQWRTAVEVEFTRNPKPASPASFATYDVVVYQPRAGEPAGRAGVSRPSSRPACPLEAVYRSVNRGSGGWQHAGDAGD